MHNTWSAPWPLVLSVPLHRVANAAMLAGMAWP